MSLMMFYLILMDYLMYFLLLSLLCTCVDKASKSQSYVKLESGSKFFCSNKSNFGPNYLNSKQRSKGTKRFQEKDQIILQ